MKARPMRLLPLLAGLAVGLMASDVVFGDAPVIDQGDFLFVTMSEDGLPVSWSPTLSVTDPDLEESG